MGKKSAIVIGAGFAGLSAACYLGKEGYKVTLLEKNEQPGGRARNYSAEGFTFDMGPSWYWMPDVFETFFNAFGKTTNQYYELKRLSPSYRVFFGKDDVLDLPASIEGIFSAFESIEKGSSVQLEKFLNEAKYKYEVGINDLVYKPGATLFEYFDKRVISGVFRLHLLQSFHSYIRKYFRHPKIIQLLEFPVLFLGAQPKDIPGLYSLMNYADMVLGTWYPVGGMHKIVEAMVSIAKEQGVDIRLNEEVKKIETTDKTIRKVITDKNEYTGDVVVGGADYHHLEQHLLKETDRTYSKKYWDDRTLAPSCIIYYLGINKRVKNLSHHNLFFDKDFDAHAKEIYEKPRWPSDPLFYVSAPSKTDTSVAPDNHENLFILIPTAPALKDNEDIREHYFNLVMERLERLTGESIKRNIVYRRDYGHNDFVLDYNSFKGNAYGLANTLKQTAILKPKMKSKKISNLYFTGQFTVPGPGVPPSLISGKIVADKIIKDLK